MKTGTKSVLFGVHAFWFHPITVALAWRWLYGRWPQWWQAIVILLHDTPGYWGCDDMDGECGRMHPELGARWSAAAVFYIDLWRRRLTPRKLYKKVMAWLTGKEDRLKRYQMFDYWAASDLGRLAWELSLYHSASYATMDDAEKSDLYLPDKASILFDPPWFYLLRGRASGEVYEYVANSPCANGTPLVWLRWYREAVKHRIEESKR
jgi:hypothetical protein